MEIYKNYCDLCEVHSQILVISLSCRGWLETLILLAIPAGLKILASAPTDKSVGYFHLSLRDKMHICKKVGMYPFETIM